MTTVSHFFRIRSIRIAAAAIVYTCLCLGSILLGALTFFVHTPWVDVSPVVGINEAYATRILDCDGKELMRFERDVRRPVPLERISHHISNAFIASEDHTFFHHQGISWTGIARSILVNIRTGRRAQGASTITQQLSRLLFLDQQKTFRRKLKEQIVALSLEGLVSKEQILETYLNHVYFGAGIYGVEAACQRFWGCSAEEASVEQAATLAGIVRSPSHYCPLVNLEAAQTCRNVVLKRMLTCGYITPDDYASIVDHDLILTPPIEQSSGHIRDMIRTELEHILGKHVLYEGGYTVKTTISSSLQEHTTAVFRAHIETLRSSIEDIDGAVVCLDPRTGGIRALVGGYDYKQSQFNRAKAVRQMGSTFKPLVITYALTKGARFSDIYMDEERVFPDGWAPRNVQRTFEGEMTLARALIMSNNIIPITLLERYGIDGCIDLARRCHLTGRMPPYLSLALGTCTSSTIELASVYGILVDHGMYHQPHLIHWVKGPDGTKVYSAQVQAEPVLPWRITSQVCHCLEHAMKKLQARYPHKRLTVPCIGKTGTTNDARTCRFVGSTSTCTTAVYLGRDDNKAMGERIFASVHALPLWLDVMKPAESEAGNFLYDPTLQEVWIHPRTGEQMQPHQRGALAILVPQEGATGVSPAA